VRLYYSNRLYEGGLGREASRNRILFRGCLGSWMGLRSRTVVEVLGIQILLGEYFWEELGRRD